MRKISYTFFLSLFLISIAYAGNDDPTSKNYVTVHKPSGPLNIEKEVPQSAASKMLTPPEEIVVPLEDNASDNSSEENISFKKLSCGRRLAGYSVRCGTILSCTVFGAGIGAAIISGEFSPEILDGLIRIGTPMIAGGLTGYAVGWGLGNYAKAKITHRL